MDDKLPRLEALNFATQLYCNPDGKNGVSKNDQEEFFAFVKKIESYIINEGKTDND